MVKKVYVLFVYVLVCLAQSRLLNRAPVLKIKDYAGEYFFNGDRTMGSILVTEAEKTKSGAHYDGPDNDLQDFSNIATEGDLKSALWVWLKGDNRHNGEGWYHHDTIYKVQVESATELSGMTGDMQREENGQPKSTQHKVGLQIKWDRDKNALVMNLGGGEEVWVAFLSGPTEA